VAEPARDTSLLADVQGLIERTYGLDCGLRSPARFLIGDAGLRAVYARRPVRDREVAGAVNPMLLVRSADGVHHVRLYFPDRLISNLECNDPRRGLTDANLRDFGAFVEEVDHLLLVHARAEEGRDVPAVELELHANVTKMLVLSLFLARTLRVPRLDADHRAALQHELLERGDYEPEAAALRQRYRDARHHAVRFLRLLGGSPRSRRPELLRRFSRVPLSEKLTLAA
jgi:hypothetical protein